MRVVLVSRELHPFGGGGIGVAVTAAAATLAEVADVTILTSSDHRERREQQWSPVGDPFPANVRFCFVQEPEGGQYGSYFSYMHLYSARVLEALRELFPDRGPDVVEFNDFLAEGVATVQAKRGGEPFLRDTLVCVRAHTTGEMAAVLNGHVGEDFETKAVFAAERIALRDADVLLHAGGDIRAAYERFYGRDGIARGWRSRHMVLDRPGAADPPAERPRDCLRMLYLGRLERRKGVHDLIRAVTGLRNDRWRLTLVGGDTTTGPLGTSMREVLENAAIGDERISIAGGCTREEVMRMVADHHVVVCPSRWECWPNVVLEAMALGRPVLGTPTGGLVEMLSEPGAGWLADGVGDEAVGAAIERLLERPDEVERTLERRAGPEIHRRLTDPDEFREGYAALSDRVRAECRFPSRPPGASEPLVSVIVPYYRLHRFVEETVRSIFAQDHRRLEVIVVNDGSFRPEDGVLGDIAARWPVRVLTKANGGLSSARNAGIAQARGRYVLPLDSDNLIAPSFVRRCVDVLEAERSVAFVTTWSRYVDEDGVPQEDVGGGFQPYGNWPSLALENNVVGDAAAVIRKRVFDLGYRYNRELTSYEDWELYRELSKAGLYGRVIPERLLLYRIRSDSMIREIGLRQHGRLYEEMNAHLIERQMGWKSKSA